MMSEIRQSRGSRPGVALSAAFAVTCALGVAGPASAQTLTTVRVASGILRPTFVCSPPNDYQRLFIVSQRDITSQTNPTTGHIYILNLNTQLVSGTPFLDVSNLSANSEQGLLGLAFHPNYAQNGYFYVYYTEAPSPGFDVLARYKRSDGNPDVADPASAKILLRFADPYVNHNGGWVAFGPDGYLYLSIGDGGSQNDPQNRGQDTTDDLFGNILRLDVDGPNNIVGDADDDEFPADDNKNYAIPPDNPFVGVTGDDEIWAYGLRNPWRPSFDRATGDLWIADVGQDAIEEIDYQPAGPVSAVRGRNYGWRCMEGLNCTGRTGCTCNAPELTLPIQTYTHSTGSTGRCSITGGYVYRGCQIPWLRGTYFYADYCSSQIWSLRYTPQTGVTEFTERTAELDPPSFTINNPTSFGEDARGELYICDQGGEIFKIVPAEFADCNHNGLPDYDDISRGAAVDCNCNGVPDTCDNDGAPLFLTQPTATAGCIGRAATLFASASGTGVVHYQWRKNGTNIAGAASSSLTISPVSAASAGQYDVVATDSCGSRTSNAAQLTPRIVGDANCDDRLDNFDIDPFVVAIVGGQAAWSAQYNCDFLCANDIDGSGAVTNFDIDPFVALIVGP